MSRAVRRPPPARTDPEAWCRSRGWEPFDFQREVWARVAAGESGLLHAPTGTGKTLAVWLGALAAGWPADGLRLVWLTPLRALAADTLAALTEAAAAVAPEWSVATRTGDTPAAARRSLRARPPTALVTTPESLSLLLSLEDAHETFAGLTMVVVDEWHELLGTKRGVQTELALARLRSLSPGLQTWGLSATLGNTDEAAAALLGPRAAAAGAIVRAEVPRGLEVETLIPEPMERFPWAGHMGMRLLPQVIEVLERVGTSLVFTNTRSQAERWFDEIGRARPDWSGRLALHHGSIDAELRRQAEEGLRAGRLKAVVATSSLDLGVDFGPVDQVLQIGSPKGIARLLQRAGRSGHCVPTHALELVECAAARMAAGERAAEARRPLTAALDVLAQHIMSVACSGGFREGDLLDEVRTTLAFAGLDEASWRWAMDFAARGGPALAAYPDFARIRQRFGRWYIASPAVARRHRMTIGTITSDAAVEVRWLRGGRLGTIEESFISRLREGDRFLFAGRTLRLFRFDGLTAWVKRARQAAVGVVVPRWSGGRMPLSTLLASRVQSLLASGTQASAELAAVAPLLSTQARWSRLPDRDTLLVEGTPVDLRTMFDDGLLNNLAEPQDRPWRREKAPIAIAAILAVIALASFNVLPIVALALIAAGAVIALGCLDPKDAYDSIQWNILILIFGMLAVGMALEKTGAAALLVGFLAQHAQGLGPIAVLALIYVVTSALTETISNNAAAILITPIAMGLGVELGVDPRAFVVAVMFAASASFATPIGYQTNTLVYNAGGYKFMDFVRIGLPLNIILAVVAVIVIPIFWPL